MSRGSRFHNDILMTIGLWGPDIFDVACQYSYRMLGQESNRTSQAIGAIIVPISGDNLMLPFRLLGVRKCLTLGLLTLARVVVGLCDLLVATAMYLLFLQLQGGAPAHHFWWTPQTTLSAALATALLVCIRAAADILSNRSLVAYVQALYVDFMLRLTTGYGEMKWTRFVQRNRSEMIGHTINSAREAAHFYHLCVELIATVTVVIAMIATLVYQSPAAACGLIILFILFYGVHRTLLRKKLQSAASRRELSLRAIQKTISDMFSAGKEIRAYGSHRYFNDQVRTQTESVSAMNIRLAILPQLGRLFADQGVVLLFLGITIAGILLQNNGRQSLPLLVFYFVLSRRLLPLIGQTSLMAGQMEGSWANVEILSHELDDCIAHRSHAATTALPARHLVVELDQVSFGYDDKLPILSGVNLQLRNGEVVVLTGESGSGKTCLLNLIAGITEPTAGSLYVDRLKVAYVPQEIALLDDSIRNNLLFGLSGKTDAELMHALDAASLSDFVAAQPLGLATPVGDNGILLSGGQRQRLGIARAILRNVTLLLLDEATSALDEESERRILKYLSSSGMAILHATHRPQAPAYVQTMYRLERGQLMRFIGNEQDAVITRLTLDSDPLSPTVFDSRHSATESLTPVNMMLATQDWQT
jgi:ABC-type bacteriocin/lantibiotic exporter with double-glycine peptidase domain